jgi:hypothetical protein
LGVAFFKRWRAADVLAFLRTAALFTGCISRSVARPTYALRPTILWPAAFYVVFLIQPFVYLRLTTDFGRTVLPGVNAAGMFRLTYTILMTAQHASASSRWAWCVLPCLGVCQEALRGDERGLWIHRPVGAVSDHRTDPSGL